MESTDSFRVVRATAAHLERLAPLFDAYRGFYGQPSDLAGARAFLADRLAREESVVFVALEGDTALGFTQLYPTFSSVSLQRFWILNDLFVAPEGRRRGVAGALLERARELAVETGAKGLALETGVANEPARRLYERLGWSCDDADYAHYSLLVGPGDAR